MQAEVHGECPLCGSPEAALLSRRARDGSPLTTVLCHGCGLGRVEPRPSPAELTAFYRDRYRLDYKGLLRPARYHVLRAARLARERIQRLSDLIAPGDAVLDVGAGGGEFLYLVRAAGCQATGIEPNLGYAGYARDELGLDVLPGFPEDHDFGPRFRLVTLFHVLEHLADPLEGLRRLAGWLLPGGCLVVEVPNFEFACQHPAHRFHRAHLFHFNSATLRRCGERAGLTPVSTAPSEDGGVLTAIFRMDGAAPSPPEPVAGNFERLWKLECERPPIRYWLAPATWRHTAARLLRMTEEHLSARRFPSRRAILDALASRGTPAGAGRI